MNTANELATYFCPFGYLDLQAACEIGDAIWMYEDGIFEVIDDFKESIGSENCTQIDPVYCVLEHILQNARNLIEELTGYDFLNDWTGAGTEIYTYWNFMCSSYDYSEEAREELIEKLNSVDSETQSRLLSDELCSYFVHELEINLSGTD